VLLVGFGGSWGASSCLVGVHFGEDGEEVRVGVGCALKEFRAR
jgi:hypothetical protein